MTVVSNYGLAAFRRGHGIAVRTGLTGSLLCLFIFLLSWTGAFRLGPWMPIGYPPLLAAYLIAFVAMAGGVRLPAWAFDWRDSLIVLFLVFILISGILETNIKTGNYIAAYLFVFLFQYLFLKPLLARFVNFRTLLNVNSWAVLMVGGYCVVEFFVHWLFDVDIQDFIPRSKEATATYNQIFNRSYGFSTEPTQVAFYLDTLGPLALWNISRWRLPAQPLGMGWRYLLYGIVGVGWATTFSAAGVAIVGFTSIVTVLVVWRPRMSHGRLLMAMLIFAAAALGLSLLLDQLLWLYGDIFAKIMFRQDLGFLSVTQRVEALERSFSYLVESPIFGIGLGTLSTRGETSSINWYLFVATEAGLLAAMAILIFLGLQLLRIIHDRGPARVPFFFGVFAGSCHLATLSTFQNANLWVLLALYGCYEGIVRKSDLVAGQRRARELASGADDTKR